MFCGAWWCHQMETIFALLALCAGNSPVTGEFPAQRPVKRSFDVFFDLWLNKRLSKHSWGWLFEMPSCSFWCHCNSLLHFEGHCLCFNVITLYHPCCNMQWHAKISYRILSSCLWVFFFCSSGQSPAEADFNLLDTARKVELYGIRMHPAKVWRELNQRCVYYCMENICNGYAGT